MEDGQKDMMRSLGFNGQIDAVEHQECPFCHEPARLEDCESGPAQRTFAFSGVCQECQNKMQK